MDWLRKGLSSVMSSVPLVSFMLIPLLIISCTAPIKPQTTAQTETNFEKRRKEAIRSATSWIYEHPPNYTDGGLLEILEQIIALYILHNNTEDAQQKTECVNEIRKMLQFIASQEDFKVGPQEYTIFLTVTAITERLGIDVIDLRKVLEEQVISDPLLYSQNTTNAIWNTVYLERLGYSPSKVLEDLMPQSNLSQELNQRLLFHLVSGPINPAYINPMTITMYLITHEVFCLTDFGLLPPPAIIARDEVFFNQLFDKAIQWTIAIHHIDMLGELIMCVKMLDLKDVQSFDKGVDFIISSQEEDGSFGITNPSRQNVYRHGILVSIMALSMGA